MTLLGHHTVEDRNNADEIEQAGGFKCIDSKAFLGVGVYYWDNHLEYAHFWGQKRYPSGYVICQSSIECEDEFFLDLIGRREDQMYLLELYDKLNGKYNCKGWPIGKFVSLLRKLNELGQYKGIFSYTAIRAMDHAARKTTPDVQFVEQRHHFTNLSPVYIICISGSTGITFHNFAIIFPAFYVKLL